MLRESQERYRDLFENSSEMIATLSPAGQFLYANPAWKKCFGFDTAALPHLYRPSVLRDMATLVGAERLLLGTDFPLLGMTRYRRALDEAGLDATELGLILGGSAAAVWRW